MTTPNHYLSLEAAPLIESQPEDFLTSDLPLNKYFLARCVTNRDLSQIEFFRRLVEEAEDDDVPPLERLKFLAILESNLDEFFMVRVSTLKEIATEEARCEAEDEDDVFGVMLGELSPRELLRLIRTRLLALVEQQSVCLHDKVLSHLAAADVHIAAYEQLSPDEKRAADCYFLKNVRPVLTPHAVDAAHPFPSVTNLDLNICVAVAPRAEDYITRSLTGEAASRYIVIQVPDSLLRLVPLGANGNHDSRFVLLEQVINNNLAVLFPHMQTSAGHCFRVTRDADIDVRKDKADDLLRLVKRSLRERRFGLPVRLEISTTMPPEMFDYLLRELDITPDDVFAINGLLKVRDLMSLYNLDLPHFKDAPLPHVTPDVFKQSSCMFEVIKKRDVLLHHPYTSYSCVTDFIRAAAVDSDVVAIKICVYRLGSNPAILQSLIEASERGKHVTAVVEIKARFDEAANVEAAAHLKAAGVHVVYGVLDLKTHCKVALVVRREYHGLQTYVHIATGNYHPTTSKVYTDFSLLTADAETGDDAIDLFNFLTGFSWQKDYRRLLVAPINLRARIIEMINREAAFAARGQGGRIIVKVNRLTDLDVIEALYRAARRGVVIDLIVRGACMLRPGIKGLSETITVRSIVGRFLEHSRIFYFANGGEAEILIGSADWMARNLDRCVEVVVPIRDAKLKSLLKQQVLETYLRDSVKARVLDANGFYQPVPVAPLAPHFDSQLHFQGDLNA